jgi:hypothetical protein
LGPLTYKFVVFKRVHKIVDKRCVPFHYLLSDIFLGLFNLVSSFKYYENLKKGGSSFHAKKEDTELFGTS